jgi:hypothetical protein
MKVLLTIPNYLKMRAPGFDVELSPEKDDVFILAPESALRIKELLNPDDHRDDHPYKIKGIYVIFCRYALSSSSHNSSTAVQVLLPSPYDIDTTAITTFRKKALMTIPRNLKMRFGVDVKLIPERNDVFIIIPGSTLRIEELLNSDYPYIVEGMTVTFRRYALSSEDDGDKDDICAICYDYLHKEQTIKTGCQHEFHERCLEHWITASSFNQVSSLRCPMCCTNLIH